MTFFFVGVRHFKPIKFSSHCDKVDVLLIVFLVSVSFNSTSFLNLPVFCNRRVSVKVQTDEQLLLRFIATDALIAVNQEELHLVGHNAL
jgi:hypothetical protein